MKNRLLFGLLFGFFVLLDQFTKLLVAARFHLGESRALIGDVVRLTYVRNPGAAFSISFGGPETMFIVTVLVIALLAYLFLKGTIRSEHVAGKIALTMLFAGAIGNLIDRIRFGEVIDFIDMGFGSLRWPVYNVADAAITIGMAIFFITHARQQDSQGKTRDSAS